MKPNQSPLNKLINNSRVKTKITEQTRTLLPLMADNDHKRIAKLIARWLDESTKKTN